MPETGWASVKNGRLLGLIGEVGFGAFITCDKNLEPQQPIHPRPFAILVLSTNHWPSVRSLVGEIGKAIEGAEPGVVTLVECGR